MEILWPMYQLWPMYITMNVILQNDLAPREKARLVKAAASYLYSCPCCHTETIKLNPTTIIFSCVYTSNGCYERSLQFIEKINKSFSLRRVSQYMEQ